MRNSLLLLTSCTLLTACGSINDAHVSIDDVMEEMDGPKVEGVNRTMLRIAQDAEQQGNFSHAAQTYQQLLDKEPDNTGYAIRFAENLRKSGEAAKALSVFHSVLNKKPNHMDALEGKGLALLSLADTEAAGKVLTTVMEQSPNRWRTLNAVGILFATKGLFDEAQQYFTEALKHQPRHAAVLNNKGLVLALDEQYSRALESLFAASKHAKLPIQQVQADLNAALIYAIAGDLKQAEKMAGRHLKEATLQNNLGLYALLSKDKQLAKTHLHMALSESKVFYEKAWNNLERLDASNSTARKAKGKRVSIGNRSHTHDSHTLGLPTAPKQAYRPVTPSTRVSPAPVDTPVATSQPASTPVAEPEPVAVDEHDQTHTTAAPIASPIKDAPTPPTEDVNTATPTSQPSPFDMAPAHGGSRWEFKKKGTSGEVLDSSNGEEHHSTLDKLAPPTSKQQNPPEVGNGFEALGDFITNW